MQSAGTVLGVLRERGKRDLPCDELYRQLWNRNLYLLAYGNIYGNTGAMTPGVTCETADGMSEAKIDAITEAMRCERYRFAPARRVLIPKKNGETRPLGLPAWPDKLVGEVVRLLLEAYYEPVFSGRSHGFRKGRGCHTALQEVAREWKGTTWFIECDISDCFGSIDHDILIGILSEKIHDQRFLRLIRSMLKAGYLEDWQYHESLSGTPQGGVLSPLLSNIYLHRPGEFAERELIPRHTRGKERKVNPEYGRIKERRRRARASGDRNQVRELTKLLRAHPSKDLMDPGYRRLRYVRYADDELLGFTGPKAEAEEIREELAAFLREHLKLTLSASKTLITHARTRAARFPGYEIIVQHCDTKITNGRRAANGVIALRVPLDVIKARCAPYRRHGKPWHRLRWQAETSMLKTLAAKHQSTVTKTAARHKVKITTPDGLRTCFEARVRREGKRDLVARFGGIPLKHNKRAVLSEPRPVPVTMPRKELIFRLRKRWCELCEHGATVAVHHVARLTQLGKPGPGQPAWAALMARKRRKTLIVCQPCHKAIHASPVANAA